MVKIKTSKKNKYEISAHLKKCFEQIGLKMKYY